MNIRLLFSLVRAKDVAGLRQLLEAILATQDDNLIDEVAYLCDENQQTLLHVAVETGSVEILALLLASELHFVRYEKDAEGYTALHRAVLNKQVVMVQEMLAYDFELETLDAAGKTALQLAETIQESVGARIRKLLQAKAALAKIIGGIPFHQTFRLLRTAQEERFAREGHNKRKLLFLGRTGAGKSTLINYLLGARYQIAYRKDGSGKLEATLISGKEVARAGHGMSSETLYPQVIQVPGADFVYCDLAGLDDNRSMQERICAASGTQLLASLPGDIQGIVVVLDYPSFQSGRGEAFKKTALALSHMLKNDLANIRSLHFVITQRPPDATLSVEGIKTQYIDSILSHLSQRDSQHSLDEEEKSLQWMLRLLSQHPEKISIADVGDEGIRQYQLISRFQYFMRGLDKRSCRDQLVDLFRRLAPQPTSHYDFLHHDAALKKFQDVLLKLAHYYVMQMERVKEINSLWEVSRLNADRQYAQASAREEDFARISIERQQCLRRLELISAEVFYSMSRYSQVDTIEVLIQRLAAEKAALIIRLDELGREMMSAEKLLGEVYNARSRLHIEQDELKKEQKNICSLLKQNYDIFSAVSELISLLHLERPEGFIVSPPVKSSRDFVGAFFKLPQDHSRTLPQCLEMQHPALANS